MVDKNNKVALLILDGWGLSAAWNGNAIKLANPANYNYLWQTYPHFALRTYEQKMDKEDQLLSSGLGYSVISSGRFVPSSFSYIEQKLNNNEITHSVAIADSMHNCKNNNSALHLCGLISDNKKISYFRQIFPIIKLAKNLGLKNLFLHLILDSDNLNNMSQMAMISEVEKELESCGLGKIASISGKNWSLDSEANFERIAMSYRAIALGEGRVGLDTKQILQTNFEKNILCENIPPSVIIENKVPVGRINDFDSIIFFNFDDKSLRSLTSIFIGQDRAIRRKEVYNINVVTFCDYFYLGNSSGYNVAFRRDDLKPNIAHLLNENNINQLYLVPEIKDEHLRYYFQGGELNSNPEINFKTIPSNNSTYGLQALAENFIAEMRNKTYNFIATAIGNCDYVAHRSKIKNVASSISEVDTYLGEFETAAIESGYTLIICSDHGFIEQLSNLPVDARTITHSKNPVPLIIVQSGLSKPAFKDTLAKDQNLSEILLSKQTLEDVAPTILKVFGIDSPSEMQGLSLI